MKVDAYVWEQRVKGAFTDEFSRLNFNPGDVIPRFVSDHQADWPGVTSEQATAWLAADDFERRCRAGRCQSADDYLGAYYPFTAAEAVVTAVRECDARRRIEQLTEDVQKYRIDRTKRLGEGGFGVAWLAEQFLDGSRSRTVVVKTLPEFPSPEAVRRMDVEIAAYSRVQSEYVVRLYAILSVDNSPALVLEYCPGGTLEDFVKASKPELQEAITLMQQTARGVNDLHRAKVCHRDLKPDNIFLDGQNGVKVGDLGLARLLDRPARTRTEGVRGFAPYLAPEVLRHEPDQPGIDHTAADVYALGGLLYYATYHKHPFEHSNTPTDQEQLRQRELGPRFPLPKSELHQRINHVCTACLYPAPKQRYTLNQLLTALDGLRHDGPIPHWREPLHRKFARWHKGSPLRYVLGTYVGLVSVVLLILLVGVRFWYQRSLIEQAVDSADEQLAVVQQNIAAAQGSFRPDPRISEKNDAAWNTATQSLELAKTRVSKLDELSKDKGHRDRKDKVDQLAAAIQAEQASDQACFILLTRLSTIQSDLLSLSLEEPDYSVIRGELEGCLVDFLSGHGCQLDGGTPAEQAKLVETISTSKVRADLTAGIDLLALLRRKARVRDKITWEPLLKTLNRVEEAGWWYELRDKLLKGRTADEVDSEVVAHIKKLPGAPISDRTGITVAVILAFVKDNPVGRKALLAALDSTYADRPNDYWLNVAIALCLSGPDHENPVLVSGYYKVALTVREDPVVLNNYAVTLIDSGHPEAALAPLERASKLSDAPPFVWNNLGIARVMTATGSDDPKLQQAEAEFRKAVELMNERYHRSYPDALLSWSQVFLKRRKASELEEVERLTTRVIEDKQASARIRGKAYANRASAHLRVYNLTRPIGRIIPPVGVAPLWSVGTPDLTSIAACVPDLHLNAAEADARRAIELAPNEVAGHQNLGGILSARGDFASAVRELNAAIKLNPRNHEVWHDLGIAYLLVRNLEAAEAAFGQALSRSPGLSQSHFLLGKVLMMQVGRDTKLIEPKRTALLNDAARHLRITTTREPRNPEPQLQLAIMLFANGDLDCARTELRRARELYKTSQDVHPPADHEFNQLEGSLEQFDRIDRYLKDDGVNMSVNVWKKLYFAAIDEHRYLTATQLLDKWVSHPEQASALPSVYFFDVATHAARAERGQSRDLKQPNEQVRASLRRGILGYGRRFGDWLCELSASGDTGRKEARRLATDWLKHEELRRFDPTAQECTVPTGERDDFSLVWTLMRSFAASPER